MAGALAGLRVLDLTDHRGLLAGRMLGLMGADVLAIEPPGGGAARREPPFDTEGESLYWQTYGTGRSSLILDRATEEARLMDLIALADVVLECGTPGRDPFLDTDALLARNPGMIHAIMTPFGLTGLGAGRASSDLTLWAAGGPLNPTESQAGVPTRLSLPQAWHHAAADALCGVMVALEARRRGGKGQRVVSNAQASATQCTLSLSMAAVIGHPNYVFRAEVKSKKKKELDLSGSGSRTQRSKWPVQDGLVEMHLALGPAAGRFTNNLFKYLDSIGVVSKKFVEWDWITLPPRIENDEVTEEEMEQARTEVAAWFATITKRDAVELALEHRLMLAPIFDAGDLLASPHAAARGFFDEVGALKLPGKLALGWDEGFVAPAPAPGLGEGGEAMVTAWSQPRETQPFAPAEVPAQVAKPLDQIKVLDLSWVVAGPMIGRNLADFGAQVIRIESVKKPEVARLTGPFPGGERNLNKSGLFENCNAGKLGVTLDMGTEDAKQIVRDLAAKVDVVVESFAPGQMDKWGLGYGVLSQENPGLVMVSTCLMGQSGPWSSLAGFGNIGAAMSGLQILAGREGADPIGPYGPYTDFVAPRLALPVLLAALEDRRKTGQGRKLDISQAEAGMQFIAEAFAQASATGTSPVARGNRDASCVPNECYRCAAPEGDSAWIAISVSDDAAWRALREVTGLAVLADPGLESLEGRIAQERMIDSALADWCQGRDAAEVAALLQEAGVAAAVAATPADLAADTQLAHWGHFETRPRTDGTPAHHETCRFQLSLTPAEVSVSAPEYGRDTDLVLRDWLGLDDARIAELREAGALT
ncbi:CaiB/BaiF CoA-transferase family protein [Pseudooceanicola nitratireducens]|uniref:CaiB/BaiF CoA-transferase family protein n=1 Tax=Pseudooceanicola nitratireducens TaxID=517719 RepID=UPI001C979F24|nr:CoA transferase [Pseudooceanicola nitratireducens]MBY6159144.1 CoA transferase [Pseudooceanicola nitratireducens]